jgi:tetratricopeptide (TPR) repeat protein
MRRLDTTGTAWIGNATSAWGNALALAGRINEAEHVLKENLASKPSGLAIPDSHNGLGLVALAREEYAKARVNFEKGLELSSQGPPSRVLVASLLGLGQAQLATNDYAAADDSLKKAEAAQHQVSQKPTPVLIEILAARGRLALAQNRSEQASQLFAQVDGFWREFAPDSRDAREAAQWKERSASAR